MYRRFFSLTAACAIVAATSLLTPTAQAGGSQSAPIKISKATVAASVIPVWTSRSSRGSSGVTEYSGARSQPPRR